MIPSRVLSWEGLKAGLNSRFGPLLEASSKQEQEMKLNVAVKVSFRCRAFGPASQAIRMLCWLKCRCEELSWLRGIQSAALLIIWSLLEYAIRVLGKYLWILGLDVLVEVNSYP